jgi:hypothetical protein
MLPLGHCSLFSILLTQYAAARLLAQFRKFRLHTCKKC